MVESADHFSFDHPQNQGYGEQKRLAYLLQSDPNYHRLKIRFLEGWKHPGKQIPHIHAIFKIMLSEASFKPFHEYRAHVVNAPFQNNPANEQFLFHGTTRSCFLVEDKYKVRLCDLQRCSLCRIIDQSFDIAKCGTNHNFNRFGWGIYTSACSSSESFVKIVPQTSTTSPEADDYIKNTDKAGTLRVVLVNRVIVGKPYEQCRNATNLVQPPSGYHSLTGTPGTNLNYEETVVYSNDAIRPAFLIVYGDAPPKSQSKTQALLSRMFNTSLVG
ncbi:uncharacterized protein LACBIDRAFT_316769 [Laccaria bicolor S238N-H82]|uniref:Predicted protein n=1 Tax=Laccaria bicolor (strain S238N-H82 / ATCC MYA-4686) TaxID=486041 RepID=B0E1L0_LACBS|nr:uncharacterized protein LACBIDRAFT_316769 [Laccaria bicolor S238N-H82]EDQ99282.1 predicted protein [Laccaria bicolor S238N-H82]|eukprot:XP_001890092.1 predicted protein [Laccaria bicolor S238N-H82]